MDCKRAQSMVTPYILKKLNDKELEEFLEHVANCRECYEELEIYFTVHYTLQRLDDEEGSTVYDVENALQNSLEESRFYVWKTRVTRFYRMGLMMLAQLFLLLTLFSQVELWKTGSLQSNPIYRMLPISETQKDTEETKKRKAGRITEEAGEKADGEHPTETVPVKEPANAPENESSPQQTGEKNVNQEEKRRKSNE